MMVRPQRFYFIRHGQREDFENPAWRETAPRPYDTPLSQTGFRQAEDVGRFLKGAGVTVLYASPFLRALQTAHPVAEALDLPIRVEPSFCEWMNPVWFDEPPALPDAREASLQFPRVDVDYRPIGQPVFPEMDEQREVAARVRYALQEIVRREPDQHVAIVAHGSPLAMSFGFLIPNVPGLHMQVASITRVDRTGDQYQLIHSGLDHLRNQEKEIRFH